MGTAGLLSSCTPKQAGGVRNWLGGWLQELQYFSVCLRAPSLGKKVLAGLTDLEAELLFSKRIGLTQISPRLSDKDMTGTTPREAFPGLVAVCKVSASSGGGWCPLGRGGCSISSAAAQQDAPGQQQPSDCWGTARAAQRELGRFLHRGSSFLPGVLRVC